MGVFAPIAAVVAARIGTAVAVALAIALIGGAGVARAVVGDPAALLGLTVAVGAGMGIAGALLPVVVKERLAPRPVAGTVAYSAGLQLGAAAAAALAGPIALSFGGWRASLAALSVATLVLVLPWAATTIGGRRTVPRIAISRSDFTDRRGWMLAAVFALFGVVYYGLISWLPDVYAELGWSPAAAGGLLSLLNVGSLVGALTVGWIADRLIPYGTSLGVFGALYALAAAGFAVLPESGLVWAVLGGFANGALFPLVLALPLRLVGSAERVAGLSSVMLGVGYSLAAVSPAALGAVRDATGTFRASLAVVVVGALMFALGLALVGRWRESPAQPTPVPR
jgi:CP family cyanate transporter-like MFS transporter